MRDRRSWSILPCLTLRTSLRCGAVEYYVSCYVAVFHFAVPRYSNGAMVLRVSSPPCSCTVMDRSQKHWRHVSWQTLPSRLFPCWDATRMAIFAQQRPKNILVRSLELLHTSSVSALPALHCLAKSMKRILKFLNSLNIRPAWMAARWCQITSQFEFLLACWRAWNGTRRLKGRGKNMIYIHIIWYIYNMIYII